uniref:Uncharacterized protein n=1 Tax=Oryza sativa subsp. japonica TaxID=39947 RepID=Q6K4A0_ORYSJ|nr:hypothetical protein [Oryza sativa Japonica Group]
MAIDGGGSGVGGGYGHMARCQSCGVDGRHWASVSGGGGGVKGGVSGGVRGDLTSSFGPFGQPARLGKTGKGRNIKRSLHVRSHGLEILTLIGEKEKAESI